jgi:hypothetical protein
MNFPIIKNVSAKSIASEIIPISPRMEGPKIRESYKDHMGNNVTVYENGSRTIHSYNPTHLYGDYGHAFGQGFFIIDESGKMVFAGDEEYNDLANKCRSYWQLLKGLQEKFNEYKVQASRGNRIAVNDKIIKDLKVYPGMEMSSVEFWIDAISFYIQADIDKGRIVKGQYGIE